MRNHHAVALTHSVLRGRCRTRHHTSEGQGMVSGTALSALLVTTGITVCVRLSFIMCQAAALSRRDVRILSPLQQPSSGTAAGAARLRDRSSNFKRHRATHTGRQCQGRQRVTRRGALGCLLSRSRDEFRGAGRWASWVPAIFLRAASLKHARGCGGQGVGDQG